MLGVARRFRAGKAFRSPGSPSWAASIPSMNITQREALKTEPCTLLKSDYWNGIVADSNSLA